MNSDKDLQPGDQEPIPQDSDRSDTSNTVPTDRQSDSVEDELGPDEQNGEHGLFDEFLTGDPIFDDKEVLRSSYTPSRLPHRQSQINDIATILVSALRGDVPSNILVYGKTGTGKTACARYVSQELRRTSETYPVPCELEYINCEVTDTRYRVLAQLANTFIEDNIQRATEEREQLSTAIDDGDLSAVTKHGYDSLADARQRLADLNEYISSQDTVPMTGWPTDRVYSEFFEAVDFYERVVIIMLDEIDKLVENSGDDTLYNLSRMNSDLAKSRVSLIGISNDLKFTDFLDPRVKSSLGEEEIVFPPYDAPQLRDILEHRSKLAFKDDVVEEEVIPLCAAFAAREHGDARRALDLLKTAGELAERSQSDTVKESFVRQAQDKIEFNRVVEAVRTLPQQSKTILLAIIHLEESSTDRIITGAVYNEYKKLCNEIDLNVLTQRRCTDLISELDMLGIVNAAVVSKGRHGRTKEISLSVPIEEICAILETDSRLKHVV